MPAAKPPSRARRMRRAPSQPQNSSQAITSCSSIHRVGPSKGNYAIVVSAGTKKVSAAGVAGEKFAKGGVALKVDVGANLNIAGQVAAETAGASKNGKKMVWIPPQAGSHMPGHWVEEGSAEAVAARTAGNLSSQDVQKLQDGGQLGGGGPPPPPPQKKQQKKAPPPQAIRTPAGTLSWAKRIRAEAGSLARKRLGRRCRDGA